MRLAVVGANFTEAGKPQTAFVALSMTDRDCLVVSCRPGGASVGLPPRCGTGLLPTPSQAVTIRRPNGEVKDDNSATSSTLSGHCPGHTHTRFKLARSRSSFHYPARFTIRNAKLSVAGSVCRVHVTKHRHLRFLERHGVLFEDNKGDPPPPPSPRGPARLTPCICPLPHPMFTRCESQQCALNPEDRLRGGLPGASKRSHDHMHHCCPCSGCNDDSLLGLSLSGALCHAGPLCYSAAASAAAGGSPGGSSNVSRSSSLRSRYASAAAAAAAVAATQGGSPSDHYPAAAQGAGLQSAGSSGSDVTTFAAGRVRFPSSRQCTFSMVKVEYTPCEKLQCVCGTSDERA